MSITEKQRRHLMGLDHHMKPVVIVGQHGLSDNLFSELDITLDTHELIKIAAVTDGIYIHFDGIVQEAIQQYNSP